MNRVGYQLLLIRNVSVGRRLPRMVIQKRMPGV